LVVCFINNNNPVFNNVMGGRFVVGGRGRGDVDDTSKGDG